ncbi:hypothetical protein [Oribacterium parvum]|nr:hypothetical protein [Oribacterium parvum]
MKKTMGKEGQKGYSRKGKSRRQQEISYSRIDEGRQRQKATVETVRVGRR